MFRFMEGERGSDIFSDSRNLTYDEGSELYGKPRKVLFLVDKTQLVGCLKVWVGGPLGSGTESSSANVQGIIQNTLYEASISPATPD